MVNENKKWYQTPLGFVAAALVGLTFLPTTIGGALTYAAYKYTKNPKLRIILTTFALILTLFLGSAYVAGIKEGITSPSPEETISQVDNGTPTLSEEEEKEEEEDTEVGGQVAGEQVEEKDTFLVIRVVDGDTIEIEGGQKVRYIGIDTPETVHPSKPVECFGQEASAKNKELVEGKRVRLEKDISETDKYGRLLRYIWLGDIFVNDFLVRQGYATSSTYPPDVKYQDQFREAEREARENNRGLWNACQAEATPTPKPPDNGETYTCDCSKTCTQMSSCDEAYYQLNECGCSKRDGDKDSVPCESICPGG